MNFLSLLNYSLMRSTIFDLVLASVYLLRVGRRTSSSSRKFLLWPARLSLGRVFFCIWCIVCHIRYFILMTYHRHPFGIILMDLLLYWVSHPIVSSTTFFGGVSKVVWVNGWCFPCDLVWNKLSQSFRLSLSRRALGGSFWSLGTLLTGYPKF